MSTRPQTRSTLGFEFSVHLKAQMQARGWSAAALKRELDKRFMEDAAKVTVSLPRIYAYLRGGTVPSVAMLTALAGVFDCQRSDLAQGPSRQGCRDGKRALIDVRDYGLGRSQLKVNVVLPAAEAEKIAAVLRASFTKRGIVVYT